MKAERRKGKQVAGSGQTDTVNGKQIEICELGMFGAAKVLYEILLGPWLALRITPITHVLVRSKLRIPPSIESFT
jgi:hypothetical protein